jgi:hypothetical protein
LVIPVVIVSPSETEEVVPEKDETVVAPAMPVPCPKVVEVKPVEEVRSAPRETKAPAIPAPEPAVHQAKPKVEPLVDVPAVPKTPAAPVKTVHQVPVIPAAKPVAELIKPKFEPFVRNPAAPVVPVAPLKSYPPAEIKIVEPKFSSDIKYLDIKKQGSIEEKNINKPGSDDKLVDKKKVVSGKKSLRFIHFTNKISV